MKVAFLIERFDPQRGGMETSAAEFLAEISALGFDVQVVTGTAGSPPTGPVPVHAVGHNGWGRAGHYRLFVDRSEAFLSQGRWDVVHAVTPCRRCHLYQPRTGVAYEALARTVAVRSTSLTRALRRLAARLNVKQRLLTRLERELLTGPQPPLVVALSRYMRRQLETAYAIPATRMREVFNGVTIDPPTPAERLAIRERIRHEFGLKADDLVVIFVGHNFRRKGLHKLLEALSQPAAQAWNLWVAGKDRSRSCVRFAARRGLEDRVRFLGSRSDVRQLYLGADVCALPTYYDPCSRTILEALSLGLPSITTRFDGSADAITDGNHGFVVDSPEAVDQIAVALQQLADPATRANLSRNALSLRDQLSMKRHAAQVASIYEELACRPPSAGPGRSTAPCTPPPNR